MHLDLVASARLLGCKTEKLAFATFYIQGEFNQEKWITKV